MKYSDEVCDGYEKVNNEKYTIKKLEMRGIPRREFEGYLDKRAKTRMKDTYCGNGWQVTLSRERQEPMGSFSLVVVEVTMAVEKENFEDFLLTFRKNFLRGGG